MARRVINNRTNNKLELYKALYDAAYHGKKNRRTIDLDVVKGLAGIGATYQEIATVAGVSLGWFSKEVEKNPAIAMALELGNAELKTSLRRVQVQMALSGNVPLLIWLGKQCLGQADKHEQSNKTEINITVQRAMEELRNIPRGQLLAAQALLSAPVMDNETGGEAVSEGVAPPAVD
jgi:hypothetical protein